ncbi:MAG: biopolymer transporter ExbD [Verrucomicrobia bacterium]|nr:MAG: biopolymer transporter ExbD [Verrucomicrobiota bacterium]
MRFTMRKRRQPPPIIIISLIDILIVLLIFLMVTTTFKQQPALKLALPESKQTPKPGSTENNLVITISKEEPYLYLGPRAVTLVKLEEELKASAAKNPQVSVSIRADTAAPVGQLVKVMDAAKVAGIKAAISMFTKAAGQP